MPVILAIETSTEVCSVALSYQDEVIELFETVQRQHANVILTLIETALAEFNLTLQQLDAIAFSCGPGSFTGIRVAASVVQGLAFAAQLPVIPISSLQVCAQSAYAKLGAKNVLVAIDARMQDIYWGMYYLDDQGIMQAIAVDILCKPEQVKFPEETYHWIGVGNAWEIYQKELSLACNKLVSAIEPSIVPHARELIKLASSLFQQGKWVSAEEALPVYLRDANSWKKISEQGSN